MIKNWNFLGFVGGGTIQRLTSLVSLSYVLEIPVSEFLGVKFPRDCQLQLTTKTSLYFFR